MQIHYSNRTPLDDSSTREHVGVTVDPGEPLWPDALFRPVVTITTTAGNISELEYTSIPAIVDGRRGTLTVDKTGRVGVFWPDDVQISFGSPDDRLMSRDGPSAARGATLRPMRDAYEYDLTATLCEMSRRVHELFAAERDREALVEMRAMLPILCRILDIVDAGARSEPGRPTCD